MILTIASRESKEGGSTELGDLKLPIKSTLSMAVVI